MMLQHSSIYHVDKSVHSKRGFILLVVVVFFRCLLPTVQNTSDILWCFVVARIFMLNFLFIYIDTKRTRRGMKRVKRESEREKWSAEKNIRENLCHWTWTWMNNKREKKRIMTNGNLSQIWIMWRPDFARLSISLHTFYMYIEWRNINWQYFWLSCAQLTARKTIGKYFHRWHDSYKRKLIFLSLATCLNSLTHSSACRIRKKESKSESEKKNMSQK